MNKTKQRRGGCYWHEQKPYISVTRVLSVIDKPALRWWFGKEVYLAMVKDPSLSQQEALAAPYKTNKKAKDRGTTVHSIVEAYKAGVFDIDEKVVEEYKGYAQAFKAWAKNNDIKIIDREKTVLSRKHQYAGTLDMLAVLNGETLPTIVDLKTGKDIYREAHIQTSAYREALLEEGTKVGGTAVLLLGEDGTYKFEKGGDEFKTFLACKVLYESVNRESLTKLGYYL